jgi:hypothetical protein
VPSGLTFAMEMSYDDQINVTLDNAPGTIAGSYLGEYVNGKWENAVLNDDADLDSSTGIHAQTSQNMSLTAFLNAQLAKGYTLDQLTGSWGVDTTNHESWAIINNGGGQFAVVPEPSTCVLLGAAVAGALAYRVRRKARPKPRAA